MEYPSAANSMPPVSKPGFVASAVQTSESHQTAPVSCPINQEDQDILSLRSGVTRGSVLATSSIHFYVCIFMLAILLPVVNTKSRRMAQVWPKCFYATSAAMAAKAAQNIAAVNCAPGQLLLGSQYLLGTLALRSDGKKTKIIRIILNINPKKGSVKDCEKSSNPERWPTQVTSTGAQTNIVEPTSRQCQWPPPGAAASTPLSNSLLSQHRLAMLGSRRLGGVGI